MTQLIPEGKQHFDDANGRPLVGGQVFNYLVGTTTFKNTYQDVALSILNTNPVVLDARGECAMYGTGSYRQILKDAAGNLIWDQVIPDAAGTPISVVSLPVVTGPTGTIVGGTVTLTATATSLLTNGSIKSFTWTLPDGSTSVTPATAGSATKAFSPPGAVGSTYTVTVFATDSAGNNSGTISWTINVTVHQPPTVPTTLAISSPIYQNSTGNTLTVSGSTASDGATITYSLTQTGAATLTFSKTTGILAGEVVTFSAPTVSSSTAVTISATAVDSMGGVSAAKNQPVNVIPYPTVAGTPYGGGFYVGRMLVSGTNYILILAPRASGESSPLPIKSTATATTGTQSTWDGLSNTNAMITAGAGVGTCAFFAKGLSIGGFTDWAVPAKDQYEMIYRAFKPDSTANNTSSGVNPNSNPVGAAYTTTVPGVTTAAAFLTGGTEVLNTGFFNWTSTEKPADTTTNIAENLSDGTQLTAAGVGPSAKTAPSVFRAVRMVAI